MALYTFTNNNIGSINSQKKQNVTEQTNSNLTSSETKLVPKQTTVKDKNR